MTYGYIRVSTTKQNPERQIRAILAKYPNAKLYQEKMSGRKLDNRAEFQKLLKVVKSGDTIVFDSASRMSRCAEDGSRLYEELYNKGVNLEFLNEPQINTSVFREQIERNIKSIDTGNIDMDNLINTIVKAVTDYAVALAKEQYKLVFEQSEKEVNDNSQRTKGGIETARLEGKQIGQKQGAKLTVKKAAPAKAIILEHSKDFRGTLNDTECSKLCGIARNTFYKYKAELVREMQQNQ